MGATEIANIAVTKATLTVELTDAGAQEGSLTFYCKGALVALSSENCEITSVEDLSDNLWRVNLVDRQFDTKQLVQLSIQ